MHQTDARPEAVTGSQGSTEPSNLVKISRTLGSRAFRSFARAVADGSRILKPAMPGPRTHLARGALARSFARSAGSADWPCSRSRQEARVPRAIHRLATSCAAQFGHGGAQVRLHSLF